MNNLAKFNFIYGANGSGKTTIARVIANEETYPSCRIQWKNNQGILRSEICLSHLAAWFKL